ncbi:MAG: DUF1002 domain-containing protein [Bacillota bacterium]
MKPKKGIAVLIILTLLVTIMPPAAFAGKADVVSLGADLSKAQQEEMLREFGVSPDDVNIIEVTIQDVTEHLSGIATRDQIGTHAISSAYVKLLPEGEGLQVDARNVTLVTEEMYANALVTAGVEDAEVMVAAPFNVTGTTALTGIMMAFEEATGQRLSGPAKDAANEEIIVTGDIGEKIGQSEAAKLVQNIKEEIVKRDIKSPEDIRQVIIDIANELNIKLSDEQIDQILNLMKKISQLDLNIDDISRQLEKISKGLDVVKDTINENKGVLQKILDAIMAWLRSIFGTE